MYYEYFLITNELLRSSHSVKVTVNYIVICHIDLKVWFDLYNKGQSLNSPRAESNTHLYTYNHNGVYVALE